jgi:hypothetical protein
MVCLVGSHFLPLGSLKPLTMKYLIFFITLLAIPCCLVAQNCTDYYYMQNNKTIEMMIYNKKGKETGRNVYKISNVTQTGNSATSTVNAEMFDPKGKSLSSATNNMQCTGGVVMMDMKMFIPAAQQQQMGTVSGSANNVYLEYPASMKEGDVLKDGQFSMDFKSTSGIAGSISVAITERKVTGKESVTTPAGTWECFKITNHTKINMKIIVGIPINMDVTEWYAPGFGVVKTESNGGKTEIIAVK